jgi:hypothetical protein
MDNVIKPDLKLYTEMRPETNSYTEKLNDYAQQYFSVLEKFKQNYVFYHKNPEYQEYQRNFEDNKSQLQSINKHMFLLANSLQVQINRLNAYITDINKKLLDDKIYYKKLTAIYNSIGDKDTSASILIDDYKRTYNEEYLNTFNIFIGIILASGILFSVFKNSKLNENAVKTVSKVTDLIRSKIPKRSGNSSYNY